ncbi:hypothetical protein [Microbispora amethystogenes]|nr:hypothetical protein [Microbispora amethystogenes]
MATRPTCPGFPNTTQGATSSAKTPAAPCHPARYVTHEVTSS